MTPDLNYFAATGYALELLAQSEYHRQYPVGEYFDVEVLPALWANQARFYLSDEGIPTALVTWAWVTPKVEAEIHKTGRALTHDEWNCGNQMFVNDWITPYNNIREIARDMKQNVFPDSTATSLRRNSDGSVRRVCRWAGVNLQRPKLRSVA